MQAHPEPAEFDLLLVGGGHSHLTVLRGLAMRPLAGVRTTLVTSDLHTPYSGMLPGHVAGRYNFDQIHFDLARLAAAAGARLVHGTVSGLDAEARQLQLAGRLPLRFDALSLNAGATPSLAGLSGMLERVIPVKPISRFLPRLEALLERLRATPRPLQVVLVGGGAGGVELMLALAARLRQEGLRAQAELTLLSAAARLLPGHPARVAGSLEHALQQADVAVVHQARVTCIEARTVVDASGRCWPADEVLWTTAAGAPEWLQSSGLELDGDGFVPVRDTLQTLSHPAVFAAGDMAALQFAPRPRSGVYAVRAGPVLHENLRRWIQAQPLRRFRPQRHALYLISDGSGGAVMSRPGWPAASGRWVWRWKDWIDRRFMARFQALAPMEPGVSLSVVASARGGQQLAAGMRCSGCGSKLGTSALLQGLGSLSAGARVPEDAAPIPGTAPELFQSIDGFPLPVSDPWLGGRLAALHALSDIHAMGLQPAGALALAGVPYAGAAQMARDLAQIMAGAELELQRADCPLLGGHSAESGELALGLAVTGRLQSGQQPLGKEGLQPGQALVLTRPLGSGVLLAGAQRGRVAARRLESALQQMLQPHGPAVAILRQHGVTGATDVTGYGLLGHAWEMASASGCSLALSVADVPHYGGAAEALAAGLESSLQRDNEDVLVHCELAGALRADRPELRLLCDPQTCGPLLAGVPADQAEACVAALQAAGYPAAVIGRVLETGPEPVLQLA